MSAQPGQDVLRVLVRHEAEIDLGHGLSRQHRLDAAAGVAAVQPGDVAGGAESLALAQGRSAQTVHELLHLVGLPQLLIHVRLVGQNGQLGGGRGFRLIVETGDAHAAVRRAQRSQRLGQPPCRAGQDRGHARVGVAPGALGLQLHIEHALAAQHEFGPVLDVEPASLPQAAVSAQQLGVALGDGRKVRAAHLFLALHDPADGDRQFTIGGAQGANGCQARGDLALVVRDAPCVQLAVALRRLKGRRVPQVERLGGLDVIVVVEQEGERAAAPLLAIDRRWRPLGAQPLRLKTRIAQQRFGQVGSLIDAHALRPHARLAAEMLDQRPRFSLVGFQVGL